MNAAVRFESDGTIARITFDRPQARNAMTWAMYEQLAAAVERLETDRPRLAILRGAGGHFVAGTDIAQFESFSSGEDGVRYERFIEGVLAQLERVSVPTLAVCEGHAAGAGLLIAACCDLRLCTPGATFSAPIARTVSNTLSLANHARLVVHLGPARTKALLMTASTLEADEAKQAGFVLDVVPGERLDQRVSDLAARIVALAPLTLRATRELVRRIVAASSAVDGEDVLREVYGSRDFREGVTAFREKRSPTWEGR